MNAGNKLIIQKSWVQGKLLTLQTEHYLLGVTEPSRASLFSIFIYLSLFFYFLAVSGLSFSTRDLC